MGRSQFLLTPCSLRLPFPFLVPPPEGQAQFLMTPCSLRLLFPFLANPLEGQAQFPVIPCSLRLLFHDQNVSILEHTRTNTISNPFSTLPKRDHFRAHLSVRAHFFSFLFSQLVLFQFPRFQLLPFQEKSNIF